MTLQVLMALLVAASLAAAGQVLLKIGATGRLAWLDLINLNVLGGLAVLAVAVVCWLYALARLPLYAVYPFNLLTLGLMFAMSFALLGERPGSLAIIGWVVIAAGLVLVAIGSRGNV